MEDFKSVPTLYSPLDSSRKEIRLVKLDENSTEGEEITCTLSTVFLDGSDKVPLYIALSYVWGDPTATEQITVNGQAFQATTNLVAFLRFYLRMMKVFAARVPIWVDALAINQADSGERASQVALMREIYTTAEFSVSWLGPGTASSASAIETATACANAFKQMKDGMDPLLWLEGSQDLISGQKVSDNDGEVDYLKLTSSDLHPKWGAIDEFLDLPYWKRTWIYQEMVLPKKVVMLVGDSSIDIEDLLYFGGWLMLIRQKSKPQFVDTTTWIVLQRMASREEIQRLMRLLNRRTGGVDTTTTGVLNYDNTFSIPTGLKASNPRDVVYGILGVVPIPVTIDYERDVEAVYLEYATFVAEGGHLTEVLAAANKVKKVHDLPTWVPELSEGLFTLVPNEIYDRDKDKSQQSNTPPYPVKVQGETLQVSGVLCDSLVSIGGTFIDTSVLSSMALIDDSFLKDRIQQWRVPYPTGTPFHLALMRVLFQDQDPIGDVKLDITDRDRIISLASAIYFVLCGNAPTDSGEPGWSKVGFKEDKFTSEEFQMMLFGDHKPEDASEYMKGVKDFVNVNGVNIMMALDAGPRSRLFCTADGYMGKASAEMQPGDLVCVLFGCRLPVILRPVGDHFELIGTCFILGFSDGEAAKDVEEGRREVREFEIR